MVTELVYKTYKRIWRASPWKSLDGEKLFKIAEYENAHREDIPLAERFLDDTEIDEILGTVNGKYPDGCVRCWIGPGVSGNTGCRDGLECNCDIPMGGNAEGSCTKCKMST